MKLSAILVVTFIFTLLSGLYIVYPRNIMDAEKRQFGFPFSWLTAIRSTWSLNMPWHFDFLWNWFIADFAMYGIVATIAMGIYEKTLKRVSKPNAYRIFFLSSSVILVVCCWVIILWVLLCDFRWISILEIDTALGIWSGLRFLLGVIAIIFAWFLIKYLKQGATP